MGNDYSHEVEWYDQGVGVVSVAEHSSGSTNRGGGVWRRVGFGVLGVVAAGVVYAVFPTEAGEGARRMAAIFVLALSLWVTEAVPLFATSLVVIAVEVWWIAYPTDIGVNVAYETIFGAFSHPIIFLFLGGFILSKAVQKERMDVQMAGLLLRPFGQRPGMVLAGVMAITAVFSMWMSNTATTAMMIVLVGPLLSQLPEEAAFRKGLILAVPFAANIGGVGTPIGTPPNAIAVAQLVDRGIPINFLQWMLFAVPLAVLGLGVLWGVLMALFPPRGAEVRLEVAHGFRLTARAAVVYATFGVTVLLWLTNPLHGVPNAVVAVLPAAVLTMTGIIGRADFNRLEWDILMLIAGGIALATGMTATGLDGWIVEQVRMEALTYGNLTVVFCLLAAGMSTAISNTVTTNLLLPIALVIAAATASTGELQQLAAVLAITSSFAMALPISTPPNAIAYGTGQIESKHILLVGGVITVGATAVIIVTGPAIVGWVLGL